MANEHKIEINKREETSKKGVKALRKSGYIPGIYYSAKSEESIPITIAKQDYNTAIKSGAKIFNISVGDSKQNVLFKSIQFHPVTDEIIHIDLYGVRMDQAVSIKVGLELIGDAIGVKDEGGLLNQPLNEIEIQCLPGDIPDVIKLDISDLALGSSLNVGDVKLDEKFSLVTPEDYVIVSVTQPMQETEPKAEASDDEFMDSEENEEGESSESDSNENKNKESDSEK